MHWDSRSILKHLNRVRCPKYVRNEVRNSEPTCSKRRAEYMEYDKSMSRKMVSGYEMMFRTLFEGRAVLRAA